VNFSNKFSQMKIKRLRPVLKIEKAAPAQQACSSVLSDSQTVIALFLCIMILNGLFHIQSRASPFKKFRGLKRRKKSA
jgi:hypothetical protein